MTRAAITFDFHNTIARCDDWFQLEVHRLPSAFFAWRARQSGEPVDPHLTHAANLAYRALRRAVHRHGHELPAERSLLAIGDAVGVPLGQEEVRHGVQVLMQATLKSATPVPGIVETVIALSEAGVRLGIVSSAVYHPFLLWALERFGLEQRFAIVTTSASAGYYKSRPEIFWQTLDRLRASPRHSLHVGDSARFDVGGAHRAGMRTVWLNDNEASGTTSTADLTLRTMRGAAPILLDLLDGHRP